MTDKGGDSAETVIEKYSHCPVGSIRPPSGPPAKPKKPVRRGSVNQIDAVPSGPTRQIRGLSSGTYRLPALSKTRSFHIDFIQSPARPLEIGTWEKTCGAAGWAAVSTRRIRPFMSAT